MGCVCVCVRGRCASPLFCHFTSCLDVSSLAFIAAMYLHTHTHMLSTGAPQAWWQQQLAPQVFRWVVSCVVHGLLLKQ